MGISDQQRRHIESQLASLGRSINVSESHRDRVLEQASQHLVRANSHKRGMQVALAVAIVLLLVSPLISQLTRGMKARPAATASQVQAEAMKMSDAEQMSFDWALVHLFDQFRGRLRK
ncbi:hypothetical protein [Roseiconus lacunae]|uniref:hypothetical protein n=1 Tax=Roseiconus lacunae TaxID=2605694 RepID=UPI0011F1B84F|nr:hypothetical protein [Roseiconus lacunae]MCD0458357.1 hypothetical protein [Roseiconus lacunae]WRQ52150.1 hypothetical protein U8335_06310 [Stieleria sp. HD01]